MAREHHPHTLGRRGAVLVRIPVGAASNASPRTRTRDILAEILSSWRETLGMLAAEEERTS